MGRSDSGNDAYDQGAADEQPEHQATLAGFSMDKYEVTVGRFRRFVENYDGTAPSNGASALPNTPGSGWQSAWNDKLPSSRDALQSTLKCSASQQTWTDSPGAAESYPINCINWYVAFAFCVWDGGRLPTEAEWERAAAGGDENRRYPWGADTPHGSQINCHCSDASARVDVGKYPNGAGRWGHLDLSGSVGEWVLDGYASDWYAKGACDNCVNLDAAQGRVMRGEAWINYTTKFRAAARYPRSPDEVKDTYGIRCVHALP